MRRYTDVEVQESSGRNQTPRFSYNCPGLSRLTRIQAARKRRKNSTMQEVSNPAGDATTGWQIHHSRQQSIQRDRTLERIADATSVLDRREPQGDSPTPQRLRPPYCLGVFPSSPHAITDVGSSPQP